jgi:ribonuclease HI
MKYIAYCDGGSRGNPGPSASGVVIYENEKLIFEKGLYIGDKSTNNEAEWNALIIALESAKVNNWYPLHVKMDSLLVISQIQDKWKVKMPHLMVYYKKAKALIVNNVSFEHIRREFNSEPDAVVNQVLDAQKYT